MNENTIEEDLSVSDQIRERYWNRILEIMHALKHVLEESADIHTSQLRTVQDGNGVRWEFDVSDLKFPNYGRAHVGNLLTGIEFAVWETSVFEPTAPGARGINFALRGIRDTGVTVFEVVPGRYTPEMWVDARDTQAVEARFHQVERADVGRIAETIQRDLRQWTRRAAWFTKGPRGAGAMLDARDRRILEARAHNYWERATDGFQIGDLVQFKDHEWSRIGGLRGGYCEVSPVGDRIMLRDDHAYMTSGGTKTAFPAECLQPSGRVRPAKFWFFHHGDQRPYWGVEAMVTVPVHEVPFTVEDSPGVDPDFTRDQGEDDEQD